MKTIFGVEWPMASQSEILYIVLLVIIGVIIILGIKYYQNIKKDELKKKDFFQYKLKRHGFSNSQLKIIYKMLDLLKLDNPVKLTEDSRIFDSALGKYLSSLTGQNLKLDTMIHICNDILEISDKLYHPTEFKKPLYSITEIENGQMIYFITAASEIYFGNVIGTNSENITFKLYRPEIDLQNLVTGIEINVNFTRIGDGEYSFTSIILKIVANIMEIKMPEIFKKDREFRHPYIDILLPCEVIESYSEGEVVPDPVMGTIIKINESEIIGKAAKKLDYRKTYTLNFVMIDYKFSVFASILANSTREEEDIFYYTFKIGEINPIAKNILKKFVVDHL